MLNSTGKKFLLSIHLLFVSTWLGTLIAIYVLLLARNLQIPVSSVSIMDKSIFILSDSIIMNISLAVAITGLLFSMFTKWGFFKYHWITVKWLIITILAIIIMFFSGPSINGMAALSDVFSGADLRSTDYLQYEQMTLITISIQILLLISVIIISVYKPWGQRKTVRVINRKIVLGIGLTFVMGLIARQLMQFMTLSHYRNLQIKTVNLKMIKNGYYSGKANYSFEYEVGVKLENHKITKIDFIKNRESHYAKLAEGLERKIIDRQKFPVDAVTGATTTSKVLMKAMETALVNAEKSNE